MDNPETSFSFYRSCFENNGRLHSIESEGIFEIKDFERIVDDQATTNLSLANITLPLLTPIEKRADWFNLDFYKKLATHDRQVAYYSHLTRLFIARPNAYRQSLETPLRKLASDKGVLAFEHCAFETENIDRDIHSLLGDLDINYKDLTSGEEIDARHYHYASKTGLAKPDNQVEAFQGLYATYRRGIEAGNFAVSDQVVVTESLEAEDIQTVWQFYEAVNVELSTPDPTHAGFNHQELDEVMQAREFLKLVNKIGQTIVNICVVVDVRQCSWMNQYYYHSNYPKEYENGLVICGVGLLTNPEVKGQAAPSLRTLGAIGKLVNLANVEHVFTFACNAISNTHVPTLTERSLNRSGLRTDFSSPVGHQVFRALELSLK